jgi:hypothetical protein
MQNPKLPTELIMKGIKDSMFLTINNSIIIHIIHGATLGATYTTLLRGISKHKVLQLVALMSCLVSVCHLQQSAVQA